MHEQVITNALSSIEELKAVVLDLDTRDKALASLDIRLKEQSAALEAKEAQVNTDIQQLAELRDSLNQKQEALKQAEAALQAQTK